METRKGKETRGKRKGWEDGADRREKQIKIKVRRDN